MRNKRGHNTPSSPWFLGGMHMYNRENREEEEEEEEEVEEERGSSGFGRLHGWELRGN